SVLIEPSAEPDFLGKQAKKSAPGMPSKPCRAVVTAARARSSAPGPGSISATGTNPSDEVLRTVPSTASQSVSTYCCPGRVELLPAVTVSVSRQYTEPVASMAKVQPNPSSPPSHPPGPQLASAWPVAERPDG